jgi:YD repeat-containing protein
MMTTSRFAVTILLFVLGCASALAADQPKFRAFGADDAGSAHYVITLAGNVSADDLAAMKNEVAIIYSAEVDAGFSAVRQFAATMTAAHAKLLSTDPRISAVAETRRSESAAPSAARHLTPHTSGYGDNGQSGTYTYDSSGNITAIGADTYVYDAENRLATSVTRSVTETYTYDAFGNRSRPRARRTASAKRSARSRSRWTTPRTA